jgi:hypothetical protein
VFGKGHILWSSKQRFEREIGKRTAMPEIGISVKKIQFELKDSEFSELTNQLTPWS